MRLFLAFTVIFISIHSVQAQIDREQQPTPEVPGMKINVSRLYGKLVDKNTGKGIEAASVQVFKAGTDSLVTGMLSKPNGDFSFENIPRNTPLKIVISAIGYELHEQEITPSAQNANDRDLGNIQLAADVQILGGVTVVSN